MMMRKKSVTIFMLLIVGLVALGPAHVVAQIGQRTPAAPPGRPTLAAPPPRPTVTRTPPSVGLPTRTPPPIGFPTGTPMFGGGQPTRTLPPPGFQGTSTLVFSAPVNIPADLPALADLDPTQLPFTLSAENLAQEPPVSSPEAYSAIVGFASDNLGLTITPLYAGVAPATGSSTSVLSQIPQGTIEDVIAQFPAEVQAILMQAASLNGAAYWGVWSNGGGVVYAGDCTGNSNCAISVHTMQVQLATAGLGAYATYLPSSAPASSNEALNLVRLMYPALSSVLFSEVTVETGFAFTATTTDLGLDRSVIKVIYAGTLAYNNQAMIYAVVGVGEGYAQAVR